MRENSSYEWLIIRVKLVYEQGMSHILRYALFVFNIRTYMWHKWILDVISESWHAYERLPWRAPAWLSVCERMTHMWHDAFTCVKCLARIHAVFICWFLYMWLHMYVRGCHIQRNQHRNRACIRARYFTHMNAWCHIWVMAHTSTASPVCARRTERT